MTIKKNEIPIYLFFASNLLFHQYLLTTVNPYDICPACFQGRVISLCSDNSLHLWEINNDRDGTNSSLTEVKHLTIENKYVCTELLVIFNWSKKSDIDPLIFFNDVYSLL